MQTTESISILNELLVINNDRVAGYEKALEELRSKNDQDNSDLESLFTGYINDSRNFSSELGAEVTSEGGEPDEGTMLSGKLFRIWMDVKSVFSGKDRHAILASCEQGEDAAQKAYKTALQDEDLSETGRTIITRQQAALKAAHDRVKQLRDQS